MHKEILPRPQRLLGIFLQKEEIYCLILLLQWESCYLTMHLNRTLFIFATIYVWELITDITYWHWHDAVVTFVVEYAPLLLRKTIFISLPSMANTQLKEVHFIFHALAIYFLLLVMGETTKEKNSWETNWLYCGMIKVVFTGPTSTTVTLAKKE